MGMLLYDVEKRTLLKSTLFYYPENMNRNCRVAGSGGCFLEILRGKGHLSESRLSTASSSLAVSFYFLFISQLFNNLQVDKRVICLYTL